MKRPPPEAATSGEGLTTTWREVPAVAQRICAVLDCDRVHYAKGYCNSHWQRWRKYGDPLGSSPRGPTPRPRVTPAEKACSHCGVVQSAGSFGIRRSRPDGLNSWCRSCVAVENRKQYHANPARRTRWRAWQEANPERYRETQRRAAERNADIKRQRAIEWRRANPDRAAENDRRKRARKRGATIGPVDIEALWTGHCGICLLPMDPDLPYPDPLSKSVDHIIPLVRGGTHEQSNLQYAHLRCNFAKGTRSA